jgi:RimJ/RimL family protein N-acetyltransferase
MQAPIVIGAKLYLRPLERADAPLMRQWINDPEVTRTLAVWRPMNLDSEEEFIGRVRTSETDIVFGVALRGDDRLIGTTGLHQIDWRSRHAGFGIEIGEKGEWGKGYGTEATFLVTLYAFERLNLNRVWLHVYQNNPRGSRAYERAGYRREGVLRQQAFREGRYLDVYVMGILRQEWEEAKQRRAGLHAKIKAAVGDGGETGPAPTAPARPSRSSRPSSPTSRARAR